MRQKCGACGVGPSGRRTPHSPLSPGFATVGCLASAGSRCGRRRCAREPCEARVPSKQIKVVMQNRSGRTCWSGSALRKLQPSLR